MAIFLLYAALRGKVGADDRRSTFTQVLCTDLIQIFLDEGLDAAAIDKSGRTALHYASSWCNGKVVQWLLDKGVDAELRDEDRRNALHNAAARSHDAELV